ncbi:Uncharacterised protein [Staphylococcus aureus]|uniref:Uncharacterized protein n=1 Tax=Staphylococcus aureus TaxID=1280 RepID=A0A380E7R7_STAAU|nr:Uncharacterised protein [Staphylococcus aureus]SUM30517.1 Uncharacterised protein [Staphylococcus aureus]
MNIVPIEMISITIIINKKNWWGGIKKTLSGKD